MLSPVCNKIQVGVYPWLSWTTTKPQEPIPSSHLVLKTKHVGVPERGNCLNLTGWASLVTEATVSGLWSHGLSDFGAPETILTQSSQLFLACILCHGPIWTNPDQICQQNIRFYSTNRRQCCRWTLVHQFIYNWFQCERPKLYLLAQFFTQHLDMAMHMHFCGQPNFSLGNQILILSSLVW